jgi:hypothetical protein
MAALHKEKGVRYIIGVPLNGNRFDLINAMIQKAKSSLPKEAILGIELGNEAQYWECPGLVRRGRVQGWGLGFRV